MSIAFERAMDEIARVWEASDHFDTKVLQFTAIVSAGAFAGAAILANRLYLIAPSPWYAVGLFIAGAIALLTFVFFALRSAIGIAFAGPLDPRLLADNPEYVADDAAFEKDMLPFIADAFDQCLNGQERKWRLFRWSLKALGVSVVCFSAALTICALVPRPSPGVNIMADEKPKPQSETPRPAPAAPDTTKKPVLGPYTITRGATIPNEPRSGSFHRDATEKK
jgi:hypothetical protein